MWVLEPVTAAMGDMDLEDEEDDGKKKKKKSKVCALHAS